MKKEKSVLMFCASFFGYEKRIAEALRDEGYIVDLYDERPGSGFVAKTCVRYNIGIYHSVICKYYEQIIQRNRTKEYDYIFVVKGEAVNQSVIAMLRQAYPNAEMILYLWDAVKNIPDCAARMKLYDRVLTFDSQDAETYGIQLRPLFFAKEYEAEPETKENYQYDFAFVGTAHTIRPLIVQKLAADRAEKGREIFSHLFLPHVLVYYYNKLLNPAYRTVRRSDIHFDSLNAAQIKQIYSNSRCILDVEHQNQRGLTMRTIELIGMQKKIITTNALIKTYDFYNPKNICVIDRQDPVVDDAFWSSAYEPVPQEILDRYSLQAFVREIFGLKEKKNGD